MNEKDATKSNSSSGNFWLICICFVILTVLGALRSMGWSMALTASVEGGRWIAVLGYVLLAILSVVMIWVTQAPERATYWLGGSVALGVFSSIPKLHFLQDTTHAALILFVLSNWRNLSI